MIHSGKYGLEDMGFLIHALGDAFAHSYDPSIKWHGKLVSHEEIQYTTGIGHLFQGYTPDHISSDPQKYLDFVGALAQALPPDNDYDEALVQDSPLIGGLKDMVLYKLNESGQDDDQISNDEYNAISKLSGYNTSTIDYNPSPNAKSESDLPDFVHPAQVIAEWHILLRDIKQSIRSGACCGK